MSAPRIKVRVFAGSGWWTKSLYWTCTGCKPFHFGGPGDIETDLAAVADVGRAHLAEYHTPPPTLAQGHSRRCGVSLAACGAIECRCVPVDPEPLVGPESGSCEVCACPTYDGVGRMGCDVCGHDSTEHEAHDGACTHPTREDC